MLTKLAALYGQSRAHFRFDFGLLPFLEVWLLPALTCLPYLEGESKLGNMVNLGEVHDGMILTRPLAP